MVVAVVICFWAVCTVRLLLVVVLVVVLWIVVAVASVVWSGVFPVHVAARAVVWVLAWGRLIVLRAASRSTWPRCCCPVVVFVVVVVVVASLGPP